MSATRIVSHYGIHWDDEVAFLMQGRGGTNAIGLKQKPPFEVKLPSKSRHCNHNIPLAAPVPNDYHWDYFLQLMDDELFRAMLPLPKQDGGLYFCEENGPELETILFILSKMSSPIYPVVVPIWRMSENALVEELEKTNVQPFTLIQCEAKHSELLSKTARAAVYQPRKMIFVGRSDVVVPPQMKRISTSLHQHFDMGDLISLPWENLGATVVRKFMRNEWPPRDHPEASYGSTPRAKSPRGGFRRTHA